MSSLYPNLNQDPIPHGVYGQGSEDNHSRSSFHSVRSNGGDVFRQPSSDFLNVRYPSTNPDKFGNIPEGEEMRALSNENIKGGEDSNNNNNNNKMKENKKKLGDKKKSFQSIVQVEEEETLTRSFNEYQSQWYVRLRQLWHVYIMAIGLAFVISAGLNFQSEVYFDIFRKGIPTIAGIFSALYCQFLALLFSLLLVTSWNMVMESWTGKEFFIERNILEFSLKVSGGNEFEYDDSSKHILNYISQVFYFIVLDIFPFAFGIIGAILYSAEKGLEWLAIGCFIAWIVSISVRVLLEALFFLSFTFQTKFAPGYSLYDIVTHYEDYGLDEKPFEFRYQETIIGSIAKRTWISFRIYDNTPTHFGPIPTLLLVISYLIFQVYVSFQAYSETLTKRDIWILVSILYFYVSTFSVWWNLGFWRKDKITGKLYTGLKIVGGVLYSIASLIGAYNCREYPSFIFLELLATLVYIISMFFQIGCSGRKIFRRVTKSMVIMIFFAVFLGITVASFITQPVSIWKAVLIMIVLVISFASFVILIFEKVQDFPYRVFAGFYFLFSVAGLVLTLVLLSIQLGQVETIPLAVRNDQQPIPPSLYPMNICSLKWDGLNVIDFNLFSRIAYDNSSIAQQDLDIWFNNITNDRNWEIKYHFDDGRGLAFYDFYDTINNISVIATRGMIEGSDWSLNVDLYNEVAIVQFLDFFYPTISLWPPETTRYIIYLLSLDFILGDGNKISFYNPLLDYASSISENRNNIFFTGHSMGGGLSQIVGSLLGYKSIVFSAPGVSMSMRKYGIDSVEKVHSLITSINPNSDLVPLIDKHIGLIQNIECSFNPVHCHKVATTFSTLVSSCGDPNGRTSNQDI